MNALLRDLRSSLRALVKNPGFTAVAVLTLALGVGANTAIFSVVNGVLLRPLPYPRPSEIVQVNLEWKGGSFNDTLTGPELEFYRDHSGAFASMAGFRDGSEVAIKRANTTEWVKCLRVTDGFFPVLAVHPAIGRDILRDETRPGGAPVAILSDSLWRKSFGADAAVLGRQLEMNEKVYTVVGVMPPSFAFVEQPADVFIPLQLGGGIEDTGMNTRVIARIARGTSSAQAQANLDLVFDQFRRQGSVQSGQQGVRLESYQKWLAGDLRTSLLVLFGAVGFLLLIACANVAGLVIARTSARQREVSIRLALGADRRQLLRQFLSESLLLAVLGSAAGFLAAAWVLKVLISSIPWNIPPSASIGLDSRVLAFTLVLAAVTTLAFGFASYWQASKPDLNEGLKAGGARGAAGTPHSRLRSALVVSEAALSVMLLVGAGLLIQTLYYLHAQKLGFDPRHVYTMATPFAPAAKLTAPQIWNFQQEVLRRIRMAPGVVSAAAINKLPLSGPNNLPTQQEGRPEHSIGGMEYRAVTPDYFQTMHISILRGRGFQESDSTLSTPVAIVSETVARAWWKDRNPLGDRIVVGAYGGRQFPEVLEPPREVVGVVADVKNLAVDEEEPTTVYVPASQLLRPLGTTAFVVRANGGLALGGALRGAVAAVNADQRVSEVQAMSDIVARNVARPAFNALLMGIFAGVALFLTSVGIYGVLSFHVARRSHEIGIRIALGARRASVLRMVVAQGVALVTVGIGIGLAGALGLSRFLASLLSGVRASNPLTYVAVSGVLLAVAVLASYFPARRATKVDPLVALRYE